MVDLRSTEPPKERVARLRALRRFLSAWNADATLCFDFSVLYRSFPPPLPPLRVASHSVVADEEVGRLDFALGGAVLEADHFIERREGEAKQRDFSAQELRDRFDDAWSIRPAQLWAPSGDTVAHEPTDARTGLNRLKDILSTCHTVAQFTQRPDKEPWSYGKGFARTLDKYRPSKLGSNNVDGFNIGLCHSLNKERLESQRSFFLYLSDTPAVLEGRAAGGFHQQYPLPTGEGTTCDLVLDPFDVLLLVTLASKVPDWERHASSAAAEEVCRALDDLLKRTEDDFERRKTALEAAAHSEASPPELDPEQEAALWEELDLARRELARFVLASARYLASSGPLCPRGHSTWPMSVKTLIQRWDARSSDSACMIGLGILTKWPNWVCISIGILVCLSRLFLTARSSLNSSNCS